jgi:hypothetical protein
MIIITTVIYPPERAQEIAKRFVELPSPPAYLVRKGPYVSANVVDGIYILTLYDIEKSKIGEGMEYLGNYMANFFGVPDFKYDIKPFFDVGEALKMIGMG